jgi:hypothetical protein
MEKSSDRLVSAVVVDFRWSQDEISKRPERQRLRNFGKRCRANRSETSALLNTIDSILLGRTSSPSGINEEMMAVKSFLVVTREMDFSYNIACSPIPERVPQGFIEIPRPP